MITSCYGITKFPDNDGNYAMVLNHLNEGNLRNYLQKNHSKLTLRDRIAIFGTLCESLYDIHEKDLIHCDLHSGNMLIQEGNCYITDWGWCGPVDDESSGKIYGIIPYIAPEIFQGGKNTKQSDVYSIGMLMWEIFAGHPPFDDKDHGPGLILKIYEEGLRPPSLSNMPTDYVQMMEKCWDADSSKRPTIGEVRVFAYGKLKEIYEGKIDSNNNSDVSSGSSSSSHSPQAHEKHPLAYHTSRILNDEIAKSKSLKSNGGLFEWS